MIQFVLKHLGWSSVLLLLIPIVILVRIPIRKSRPSTIRISLVSLTGVAIVSLWFHYAEVAICAEPMTMSGAIGVPWLNGCKQKRAGMHRLLFNKGLTAMANPFDSTQELQRYVFGAILVAATFWHWWRLSLLAEQLKPLHYGRR